MADNDSSRPSPSPIKCRPLSDKHQITARSTLHSATDAIITTGFSLFYRTEFLWRLHNLHDQQLAVLSQHQNCTRSTAVENHSLNSHISWRPLEKYEGFRSNFRPQTICGMHLCTIILPLPSMVVNIRIMSCHCANNILQHKTLHFNGYFPGEPRLADVYWSKGWWRRCVTTGAINCAKFQSNHHHQKTPSFLQAGCPSCRPTNNVKALKGKISHSMD